MNVLENSASFDQSLTIYTENSAWLEQFRMGALLLKFTEEPAFTQPGGYYIGNGPNQHYRKHSVVCFNGTIVHDPHPDRLGISSFDDLIVFTTLEPTVLVNASRRIASAERP